MINSNVLFAVTRQARDQNTARNAVKQNRMNLMSFVLAVLSDALHVHM